ncbi:short chain dehydrogenase reductase [Grosmannia clavigera kw1407]|uniref:Short chain dehydrogenase reductase n=1 Tax=Grosmannia clavigera (strain kw1407 / UAMH 11150) TaxID=655863 RepID=F0XDF2_GROCL|nr:short chain dehydrogenase reductase [Grosmannia clavigera kw1407]EFX04552.1 short chain dehydrogenase reductase [Grosmannia clavigera kw1407]
MAPKTFYAVIAGVGAGTGRSVALKFAKKYPVALLARKPESYQSIVAEIEKAGGTAIGISTDVTDQKSVEAAFVQLKKEEPFAKSGLAAAVYNASGALGHRTPFLETTIETFDLALAVNPRGLYFFAQSALPLLLASVPDSPIPPTLVVTGATASNRGSARFSAFAAGKFAVRGLTQSLSREFHPQGVHVAHVIIDAVIDIPRTKAYAVNNGAPDGKLSPDAIADEYWHLHNQHRSGFTQELDLRPYVEKF